MKTLHDMMAELARPSDPALAPGAARCPGETVQERLAGEDSAADPGLVAERYDFLGDEDLSFSRYTDPVYHEQEAARLWPKVWQWACREEHIPEPGDFHVYDVGPYSALVIRDETRTIRAFINACPHRGMRYAVCRQQLERLRQAVHPLSFPWHELASGQFSQGNSLSLGLSARAGRRLRPDRDSLGYLGRVRVF